MGGSVYFFYFFCSKHGSAVDANGHAANDCRPARRWKQNQETFGSWPMEPGKNKSFIWPKVFSHNGGFRGRVFNVADSRNLETEGDKLNVNRPNKNVRVF